MGGPWGKPEVSPHAKSSPGWTRTNNISVNSRTLCQLSYRGSLERRHCSHRGRSTLSRRDGEIHLGRRADESRLRPTARRRGAARGRGEVERRPTTFHVRGRRPRRRLPACATSFPSAWTSTTNDPSKATAVPEAVTRARDGGVARRARDEDRCQRGQVGVVERRRRPVRAGRRRCPRARPDAARLDGGVLNCRELGQRVDDLSLGCPRQAGKRRPKSRRARWRRRV